MDIVRITEEGFPDAARVLADAFLDDPMVLWTLGGDFSDREALRERMTSFFTEINRGSVAEGMMWGTEDGKGIAVWLTPETTEAYEAEDLEMRPRLAPLSDDGGARYAVFWDWIAAHIPEEPTWFLDQIAVEAEYRGKGIGAALIEHGIAMAERAGQQCFLETGNPRNVAYYERFGFEVVSEGDGPGGGPHVWFMLRL